MRDSEALDTGALDLVFLMMADQTQRMLQPLPPRQRRCAPLPQGGPQLISPSPHCPLNIRMCHGIRRHGIGPRAITHAAQIPQQIARPLDQTYRDLAARGQGSRADTLCRFRMTARSATLLCPASSSVRLAHLQDFCEWSNPSNPIAAALPRHNATSGQSGVIA
jgi:hypothetical protein